MTHAIFLVTALLALTLLAALHTWFFVDELPIYVAARTAMLIVCAAGIALVDAALVLIWWVVTP